MPDSPIGAIVIDYKDGGGLVNEASTNAMLQRMHQLVVSVIACCGLLAAADYPAKTWEVHSRDGWPGQKLKAVRDFMAQ